MGSNRNGPERMSYEAEVGLAEAERQLTLQIISLMDRFDRDADYQQAWSVLRAFEMTYLELLKARDNVLEGAEVLKASGAGTRPQKRGRASP